MLLQEVQRTRTTRRTRNPQFSPEISDGDADRTDLAKLEQPLLSDAPTEGRFRTSANQPVVSRNAGPLASLQQSRETVVALLRERAGQGKLFAGASAVFAWFCHCNEQSFEYYPALHNTASQCMSLDARQNLENLYLQNNIINK